jgi:hypothetical protein
MVKEPNGELKFYKRVGFAVMVAGALLALAGFIYSKADAADVDRLEDRIYQVEANDLVQTKLLERIESKIDKMDK